MTPWVLRLIIANGVMFFLTLQIPGLERALALFPSPGLILRHPWTPLTYMFLHAGFAHIFFNMLALFFFGPQIEVRLGSRDFLLLYFISGLGGALASLIFAPNAPVVGASAAVFGIMLGFAMYWPDAPIYLWMIVPIKAKWLITGLVVISLFSGITGAEAGVAHFAHLGGFATGWLYLKWRDRQTRRRVVERAATTLDKVSGRLQREEKQWRSMDLDRLHELNRQEVERILRKIDVYGVDSLTREEREFMNRMVL